MNKVSLGSNFRSHPSRPLKVVGVHSHVGIDNKMPWLGTDDAKVVLDRAARAGIDTSVISHLDGLYRKPANEKLLSQIEDLDDALMWWVVNPKLKASMQQYRHFANHPKVIGIKIGPTYHKYKFSEHAQMLFDLAGEMNGAILTHSGDANDMPSEIVRWANRNPSVRIVVAHFGNCQKFEGHLKAMRHCTSPNCMVDTSSAVSMVCEDLERGIEELGASRFIFGSDSPLYSVAAQCARILEADLTLKEKQAILGGNACRWLLNLPKSISTKN